MKELNIDQIDEIRNDSKSIILIYAEGCSACDQAKPFFDKIESIYDQFYFYKVNFSPEILPFYNKYTLKSPVMIQPKNVDGVLLNDENGKPIIQFKLDEEGKQILETQVQFPNFFVFVNELITEENEHGFAGNIAGFNPGHVEFALSQMSKQKAG